MARFMYPAREMKTDSGKNIRQKRTQWHKRFVTDYLKARYSNDEYYSNVKLGSIPDELGPLDLNVPESRLVQAAYGLRADVVIIKPEKVRIIKARMVATLQDITSLPVYGRLFRYTWRFVDYWDLPVELQYVCAKDSPAMQEIASWYNVEIEHFKPEWIDSYLDKQRSRDRRPVLLNASDFQPAIKETPLVRSVDSTAQANIRRATSDQQISRLRLT